VCGHWQVSPCREMLCRFASAPFSSTPRIEFLTTSGQTAAGIFAEGPPPCLIMGCGIMLDVGHRRIDPLEWLRPRLFQRVTVPWCKAFAWDFLPRPSAIGSRENDVPSSRRIAGGPRLQNQRRSIVALFALGGLVIGVVGTGAVGYAGFDMPSGRGPCVMLLTADVPTFRLRHVASGQ